MSQIRISKNTRKLAQASSEFLNDYLPNVKRRLNNTVISYENMLTIYFRFLKEEKNIEMWNAKTDDFSYENILLFLNWSKNVKHNSSTTINKRLSEIKNFCGYLCRKQLITPHDYSKIEDISSMVVEKRIINMELTTEQVKILLSLPNTSSIKGLRDCCFMTVLYDSGCRCDELRSLQLKDVSFHNDVCDIKILGKGRKYRVTPLSNKASAILKEYLNKAQISYDEAYIFPTNYNGINHKMSADNAARILNKYEKLMKETNPTIPHLHPHLFRHTRAMHLYRNGVPLPMISQWLGHENLETSLIYASADTEMKREAINKAMNGKDSLYTNEEFKFSKEEIVKAMFGL